MVSVSGISRRQVLGGMAAVAAAAALPRGAWANPLGLPLGLQLYSVRDQLAENWNGTLKRLGELGFREVEGAGWRGHSAAEVKADMDAAGLRCVSAHYNLQELATDAQIDALAAFHHTIGAQYVICPFPGFHDPANAIDPSSKVGMTFEKAVGAITLDDLRFTAGELNRIGKRFAAAGIRFGYHNHTMEFRLRTADGQHTGYDELMRLTDPALVTFELDAGWADVANGKPVELLHRYATRISMLHVKDFGAVQRPATAAAPPPAAELGRGTVDLRAVIAAADRRYIRHIFAEQEHFTMPPFESLRIDAAFMKSLS